MNKPEKTYAELTIELNIVKDQAKHWYNLFKKEEEYGGYLMININWFEKEIEKLKQGNAKAVDRLIECNRVKGELDFEYSRATFKLHELGYVQCEMCNKWFPETEQQEGVEATVCGDCFYGRGEE